MNTLDLLTRLYDATECLSDGMCGHEDPDETCIVCTVGDYLERRYAAARETAALREFEHAVRAALAPADPADGPTFYQRLDSIAVALKTLDDARGGES